MKLGYMCGGLPWGCVRMEGKYERDVGVDVYVNAGEW